jgi:hypothetical protein
MEIQSIEEKAGHMEIIALVVVAYLTWLRCFQFS